MTCAWMDLLEILPAWMRQDVDRIGNERLQELRIRSGQAPELVLGGGSVWLDRNSSPEDLKFILNTTSHYSPWAVETMAEGYLTAPGGHRIGICGDVVMKNGTMETIRQIRSLCIRVARDYPGISGYASQIEGSILILGPPGSGKTTFLRDLLRTIAKKETVAVADERRELFPEGLAKGKRMDIITGCRKGAGIDILLRTMGPSCIGVDEITSEQDCSALVRAGWCGVRLIATAHAASVEDLYSRPVYKPLVDRKLFDHIVVMNREKQWREEIVA